MVLETSFINTQHYKVRRKGKVEQSREKREHPPLHLGAVAIEKGAFWSPSTTVTYFIFSYFKIFPCNFDKYIRYREQVNVILIFA